MPSSAVVVNSEVPNHLSSHSDFNSYSLRTWETTIPSPVNEIFTSQEAVERITISPYLQKCLVHSILGMKYELNFKRVYCYYLLLLCFSESPQDLFVCFVCQHFVVPSENSHLHTAHYYLKKPWVLDECLYHIYSLVGRNLILPAHIKDGCLIIAG